MTSPAPLAPRLVHAGTDKGTGVPAIVPATVLPVGLSFDAETATARSMSVVSEVVLVITPVPRSSGNGLLHVRRTEKMYELSGVSELVDEKREA